MPVGWAHQSYIFVSENPLLFLWYYSLLEQNQFAHVQIRGVSIHVDYTLGGRYTSYRITQSHQHEVLFLVVQPNMQDACLLASLELYTVHFHLLCHTVFFICHVM